ncbi:MAG TPA: hypothetical protein VH592_01515 [Gemmataceae bacterium]
MRRTVMRPSKPFSILVLLVAGCLSPITRRIDTTNEQVAVTNQHLAEINAQTREANTRMIAMNQQLVSTNAQLIEANRRLEAIEKGLPRFPRIGTEE